ncbi:MAG: hypothetical protein EPO13_09155 [Actinomycetota bacterium]|nr:MAG: hypothetical protein EPO13_09155 [Actinomycetota bacterium]
MPTNLTADQMLAIVAEHSARERDRDWPGALRTLVADPYYEHYPNRLRFTGVEPIVEAWKRLLPQPCFDAATYQDFHRVEFVNGDAVLHITDWTFADGDSRKAAKLVAVYTFSGDLMASEKVWFDATLLSYVDKALDADFRAMSGVALF